MDELIKPAMAPNPLYALVREEAAFKAGQEKERARCAEIVRQHKDTEDGINISLQLPFNACIEEIAKAIEVADG